jgi:hypothetical protein
MKKSLMLVASGLAGLTLGLAGCRDDEENGGGATTTTVPAATTGNEHRGHDNRLHHRR